MIIGVAGGAGDGEGIRCAEGARQRSDPMAATAPPARRFLLVEIGGPWPRDAISQTWPERSGVDEHSAAHLLRLTGPAGVRALAVRRYGDPVRGPDRAWALADVTPGRQGIRWGTWRDATELLDVAAAWASGRPTGAASSEGGRTVALVCTHGGRDPCCAIRGRPVVAALDAGTDADVWECSHLSGDRFAGNLLLLPDGLLFGGLDPAVALLAVQRHAAGRLLLDHFRGRFGQSRPAQAAEYQARLALGEDRLDAVRVLGTEPLGPARDDGSRGWRAVVEHRGRRHSVELAQRWSAPARLTCTSAPDRVDVYELVSFSPLG
jgi:hypothetical protein